LTEDKIVENVQIFTSPKRSDKISNSAFFCPKFISVTCDIIEEQLFGDESKQILQHFVSKNGNAKIKTKVFNIPNYVIVNHNFISSIKIGLLADNQYINFQKESLVTCLLHFRRCGLII
jgi:hypothetical protein